LKKVVITGANGQLGKCLKDIFNTQSTINALFLSSKDLDVRCKDVLNKVLTEDVHFCINCAAYTNVDKSESEPHLAKEINTDAVCSIAETCKEKAIKLIHVSTDFVFDGNKNKPYNEDDEVNPLGVYGKTKLEGEKCIQSVLSDYYIIRTSWLYSEYGNNFLKTMLKLGAEREDINVVNDQFGSPTYAKDLARVILMIITNIKQLDFGLYHYSNEGVISWHDFAKTIFEEANLKINLQPIPTSQYKTLAKRPSYSVLDTNKIKKHLNLDVSNWKDSLKECLKLYNN